MAASSAMLTGVAGGADILSGLFGMSAADAYASSLRSRADLLRIENEADIARYAEETRGFKAEQSLKYLKSGVALEGSPLEILDETTRVASENISAMRSKGEAEARAMRAKGAEAKGAARVNFIRGVAGAAERTIRVGDKAGWWDKKSAAPSASSTNLGFGGTRESGFGLDERYR